MSSSSIKYHYLHFVITVELIEEPPPPKWNANDVGQKINKLICIINFFFCQGIINYVIM